MGKGPVSQKAEDLLADRFIFHDKGVASIDLDEVFHSWQLSAGDAYFAIVTFRYPP